MDCYTAAIGSSTRLSNIEKFNYLRSYLTEEALKCIDGLSLTNDNYDKAMELLKKRFGNSQMIISSHMNQLLKTRKIDSDRDLRAIRNFYDEIESHVRSLSSLGIHGDNFGSLLAPIIMERLPHEFRLTISRDLRDEIWDLSKLLDLIRDEIKARESCIAPSTHRDTTPSPSTGFNLFTSNTTPSRQSCVFCRKPHWSDKCTVISDVDARKEFLKKGGRCFLCLKPNHMTKECHKKKPCYYCQGMHNSAICSPEKKVYYTTWKRVHIFER